MNIKLTITLNNTENIEEIYSVIKEALYIMHECGSLYDNLEIKENKICSEGNSLEEDPVFVKPKNDTYALLFSEIIAELCPTLCFSVEMNFENGDESTIHVTDTDILGYVYTKEYENLFLIGEREGVDSEDWEPTYYEDFKEFTFDYFLSCRGKDLSFFKDTKLSEKLKDTDLEALEKEYKEFDEFLNGIKNTEENKIEY